MGTFIDITNMRFGRLLVLKRSYVDKDNFIRWECLCDCGNTYFGRSYELRRGTVKSCGCLANENRKEISNKTIHGLYKTPIYSVWKAMKSRCYREKDKRYLRYGGRGITVCDEWINNPEKFITWSYGNGYKQGLSIDRIDNNKGYAPENCRFVSTAKNNRNSSNTHLNESDIKAIKELSLNGMKQIDIAPMFNIAQQTVSKIVNNKTWKNE